MSFRTDLETYRGPLDLLLYLVRKQEIDVSEISVSMITEQFQAYLAVLEELQVDDVGEFVDLASSLLEMKSRSILPHGDEVQDELEDPRDELVQRLLEYKKYKDAASLLEEQGRQWCQRYARQTDDLPPRQLDPAAQPIQEVELWDLVSALGRILRDQQAVQPSNIVYDETPLQVYMERIHQKLLQERRASLSEMLEPGMHKSAMIGVFLAILELVRHHSVRTEQEQVHGEIWVLPGKNFGQPIDALQPDRYELTDQPPPAGRDDLPGQPR